jgi:rhamnosyltransferase
MTTDISIIIRTKNEERWIGHCLKSIFSQEIDNFEVIIVDNESSDNTLAIVSRYPIKHVVKIDEFFPGKAINDGIKASSGKFIVCLSAHCIPKRKDWLTKMRENFRDDAAIAGVYGRQLPVSYTDPIDKRDLLLVFGRDKRVQIKDYFFHNANSMFRRDLWERFPFDERVKNIEDRLWGKVVTEAGYNIIYEPEAPVFHHHGLHHGNTPERAQGVVSVMQQVDGELLDSLPESAKPENAEVVALIPVIDSFFADPKRKQLFDKTMEELLASKYLKKIYVISESNSITAVEGIHWIDRNRIVDVESLSLDEVLQHSLILVEKDGVFPDSVLYVNYDYMNRPPSFFDSLIKDYQYNGCDTAFAGYVDFAHYWFKGLNGEFIQTDDSFVDREKRDPVYRALYGLGCLCCVHSLRKGKMISGKVGIQKNNNR